jgi:2-oxoglutarate ferredoxin oxidoreductase subunit alpha
MATTEFAVHGAEQGAVREPVVNDFSIQVATVNGSGSQSANTVLLRTIFQMGVPVSGKNMFPSNIAGLPTWYTIRASKKGYIARKKEIDFLVAMNPETAREDVMSLAPGAVALYDEPLKLNELRSDLIFYAVPYDKITAAACPESKLRKLVKNMVYVGVVARLLNLDMTEVEKALRKQFAKKVKAAELNWGRSQSRLRLRCRVAHQGRPVHHRAHEPDQRDDHHRRQFGRGHRLDVCRSDGRDVVSDYAFVVAR